MWAHLWTKGPCPPEYLELILCRDVYHCTPDTLRSISGVDILTTLTMLKVEGKVRALHNAPSAPRSGK